MFKTPANPLHTLPLLVKKCKTLLQFKSIHAYILKSHLSPLSISHLFTLTSLPTHTHLLSIFHTLTHRNTFIYNSMIRSFTHNNSPLPAILYYLDMLNFGLIPNNYTYPPLIKACSVLEDLSTWKLVHSHVVKFGYCDDLFVVSSLVELYSRISDMETARRLFDEMPQRDVVLWTVMIDGYGKMGDVENARKLFDEMPQRNVVSWSAMMAGYSRVSDFKQVLCLFGEMQKLGVKPNESVLVTVLTACGNLGALAQGLWVHSYVKQQRKFESNTILGTAITDMFAKCGATDAALLAFDGIKDKDVGAWNAIICGVAMNGDAMRSLELFNKMWTNRAQPNETTFIAILTACTHAGLVDEGLRLFDQMGGLFKLNPRLEHYACIVDLLARAGKLEEAEKFVEERIGGLGEGDANVWGALLGACRTYGNVEVGNRVWKKLAGLGVADSGTYMILYNMYKESGWEMEANQAIQSIKEKGIKKQPGCSSIEVDGMVDEFIAGDLSHPQAKNMSETLQSLVNLMNSEFVSIENMPVKFVF